MNYDKKQVLKDFENLEYLERLQIKNVSIAIDVLTSFTIDLTDKELVKFFKDLLRVLRTRNKDNAIPKSNGELLAVDSLINTYFLMQKTKRSKVK